MARHIHKVEVLRADELDRRALEESVVLLAHVRRILNRLARNLVHVGPRADDADCNERESDGFCKRLNWAVQRTVVLQQHDRGQRKD